MLVDQIEFVQVRVLRAIDSVLEAISIVLKHLLVADVFFEVHLTLLRSGFILFDFLKCGGVNKLTPISVRAISTFKELLAKLSFIH